MQNEKIKFKPLHEGVGFHPFSEGLPYAPQAQTKTEPKPRPNSNTAIRDLPRATVNPAGATSAGIPSFNIPSMPKTTRQLREQKNNPLASSPVVTRSNKPIIPGKSLEENQDADLRTRFFAYLLDTVVHLFFWIAITLVATVGLKFEIDGSLITRNWTGFLGFFLFSQWFFIAMQETLFENSIGKSFFGLEFRRNRKSDLTSSLFVRSIVFMIGSLTLLGFFFRPQDQFAEIQYQSK
jgi:hypothetical protein